MGEYTEGVVQRRRDLSRSMVHCTRYLVVPGTHQVAVHVVNTYYSPYVCILLPVRSTYRFESIHTSMTEFGGQLIEMSQDTRDTRDRA